LALVWIPSLLRPNCAGSDRVTADGATLYALLADLDRICPGISERVVKGDRVAPGITLFVDGEEALSLNEPVTPNSEVSILPAIAGG
jgi:sulfur-carrier protein